MNQPLGLAAIGVGNWAAALADAYTASEHVRLISCYSRTDEKRRSFADRYGCDHDSSLDALLARPDVEAVVVTVTNDQHASVVEQAARAGKHIFVDKPIANTMVDALRIAQVVKETGVRFLCGHNARRMGGIRKLKELIDTGAAGQVSMVELTYTNPRGRQITPGNWRADPVQTPGGSLTQIGIHQIDNLQYLLGPVRWVFNSGKPMYTAVETDTVTQAVMELESGQMAYLGTNWTTPGTFAIRVYGTQAVLVLEQDLTYWSTPDLTDAHTRLRLVTDGKESPVELPRTNHLREQFEELAQAVRTGTAPEVDAQAAIRNLAVVLAAVKSAGERRIVRIDEVVAP